MSEPEAHLEAPESADVINLTSTEVDPLLEQWAKFRDLFASAMESGLWTIEDLEQRIAHRRAFFFPGRDAAMVGQIETYPGGERVFQVMWAVGNVDELVSMAPGVEAMARMMGCGVILIEGRMAWKRVLQGFGYKPWSITLHKRL